MIRDQVEARGRKLWADFRSFTPGQKAVTLAALTALLVGGYLLLTWRPAPDYAPLYSNLAASDASAIVDKLNSQGISYKLADGGAEILVPKSKVNASRLAMSSAGLPASAQTGYSLLDKEGVTTSQFRQQVDYQRAIEGVLAQTIQSIDGVQAASVHLAIPQQSVFNDGKQQPTAAVLLTVKPGTTLSDSQVQSVVYLVSSSVPGLTTNAVTVSDSNGDVLKAPGQGSGSASTASTDTQAKATQAYNTSLSNGIESMLDKVIGPNNAIVTVNSQLDFDQTRTTRRSYIYDPKTPPVSQSQSKETYQGAGGSGGQLGSSTDTTSTASGNGKYVKTNDVVNNALGTLTQTTDNAPGQVRQLSIAVLLDKSAKNVNVAGISQLVRSGVGFNATRGDTLSVQAMPFDTSGQQAAKAAGTAAAKAAAAKAAHARLVGWAKNGVLVLLVGGLILWAFLANRRRRTALREPDDDLLGLHEPDATPSQEPAFTAPGPDRATLINQRRDLATALDDRPQDVARVLASWLNTKETDR